jgi:hypothetical protein
MQSMENNEAIVSINGVQIRAKLEMALQPGQSAMLQVQPESNGSLVLLKAVDLNTSGLLDDTFREFAKLLGLPDQKWALALIRNLRQEGFAFNRTTAAAFQQAAALMPKGADAEQWMTAAATAFRRGMPMTAATIASLQQVMFGKPAHELLDQLQRQLTAMGTVATAADAGDTGMPPSASRVLALLQQGAALFGEALSSQEASTGPQGRGAAPETLVANPDGKSSGKHGGAEAAHPTSSSNTEGRASQPESANLVRQAHGQSAANWLGQMMKWMGVDHELQLAKAATDAGAQSSASQAEQAETGEAEGRAATNRLLTGTQGEAQAASARNAPAPQAGAAVSHQGATQGSSTAQPAPILVGQQDGVDIDAAGRPAASEQRPEQSLTAIPRPEAQTAAVSRLPGLLAGEGPAGELAQPASGGTPAPANGGMGAESLKSALMSLASGADVPPQVKETAQQLIGQITGQQLLLSPERNNSVFTHVTMFIPLKDASGEQTASVQIQTRRGRRGELDADNCRLLFNLSMSSIGDTLVDVQITDKIVSLQLWNDHPAIAGLVEGSREELSARLGGVGYQLLSMRTKSLPKNEMTGADENNAVAGLAQGKQAPPSNSPWLTAARYKGVDYRA